MDEKGKIAVAAGKMSGATMISRVLGFVRDMVLAFYFGATGLSDAFFVAFRAPNLLREIIAEGPTTTSLIPVLTEYKEKSPEEAKLLVRAAIGLSAIASGIVCILGIIFAPSIVSVLAYGFIDDKEQFTLTVHLTRIMFPFLFFISLAAVVMGALNARRVFFVPALAPAVFNITLITSLLVVTPFIRDPLLAAALGVSLGGATQLAFQLPAFLKQGYDFRPLFTFSHPGLRRVLKLFLPVTLSLGLNQFYWVVAIFLASFLAAGSITYLTYSFRLIQLPVGVFGVAMGLAVLPSLSEHAVKKDFDALREDFSFALRLLIFLSMPAMVGLIALAKPIVNLLFQRGAFDYAATLGTSEALVFYAIGIWAFVGSTVLRSAFFSMQDTRTPVKCAAVSLIVNLLLSVMLMGPLKHSGLALAAAISMILNFLLLIHLLRRKLGRVEGRRIVRSFAKTFMASVFMGLLAASIVRGDMWTQSAEPLSKAALLAAAIFLSACFYVLLSRIMKCEELSTILDIIKGKYSGRQR